MFSCFSLSYLANLLPRHILVILIIGVSFANLLLDESVPLSEHNDDRHFTDVKMLEKPSFGLLKRTVVDAIDAVPNAVDLILQVWLLPSVLDEALDHVNTVASTSLKSARIVKDDGIIDVRKSNLLPDSVFPRLNILVGDVEDTTANSRLARSSSSNH
jgi:hypothetical protein